MYSQSPIFILSWGNIGLSYKSADHILNSLDVSNTWIGDITDVPSEVFEQWLSMQDDFTTQGNIF